ncbi:DUF3852 domain-containing protein [Oscillibacter sp. CU971]|mgnify:FL=1|jgi:hypothetical protein|uniref:DUF3852 domain-containing protein n=1 Tax=Oscillibacter sp. CU971 TaxID=2780102 RepID=UPI00195DFA5E|nr:DUF3852 domain-containing protein [Oscillibacter sp. CU971]
MKPKKLIRFLIIAAMVCAVCCTTALAAGGDVSGAIQQTWTAASGQVKTVVDTVVFPALDMILAIAFFVKVGTAYFDYRQRGQFEWAPPAILLVCLIFCLTAPSYIWGIIGL